MFTKNELQTIFQSKYNADTWQKLLVNLGVKNLRQTPERLDTSTTNETAFYLGKITTPDAEIGLFYYQVGKGSVAHKRIGLRNLVKTFVNPRRGIFDAALAVFNDGNLWRISLISDIKSNTTAPKRYTFVFGDANHYYHTAVNRFLKLQSDGVSLKTLMEAFSVESLTIEFYKELFDWYQWALSNEMGITYPNDISTEADDRIIQEHLIRLITRLMFVWFIKQKKLIPDDIFDTGKLHKILKDFDPASTTKGNYYNAILQNLFFATLNRPINERCFAANSSAGHQVGKEHYGIKTLYRDDNKYTWFKKTSEEIINLFKKVPFLNGGLFECLDKEKGDNDKIYYYDGFSRENGRQRRAFIPNCLFFDKDTGLLSILKRYNFTIEENTPNDVDVALDPELLGKVFENLLGAYNPETKETARKQSGSFYTPREIVNYMVDESLIAYLKQNVGEEYENEYRKLLICNSDTAVALKSQIYNALRNCKILDPACGSGAFPMGILNRIICMMEYLGLPPNISIFDMKLHLIENCIFGVDVQTIAVQISKLRFFISLIVEQTPTEDASNNYGIKPLPNLETKFVAANTLTGIKKKKEGDFTATLFENPQIEVTKKSLLEVRHEHFSADTVKKKEECRKKDKKLREKLARLLEENNEFAPDDACQLAAWNPYDQNTSSLFFDPEWMFGLTQGFDIVIGNPPYFSLSTDSDKIDSNGKKIKHNKLYEHCRYETLVNNGDIYCLFYERGYQLLKPQAHLCFITSNKWMRAGYGENTRKFFTENTNPEQLIDFAGVKIFESATVDTNILMFAKDKNRQQTQACIVKKEGIKDLSVYFRQNATDCSFSTSESWVILSPIEQRIKAKIEAVGA
ncbi:MAG: Eco57I restriction-modification methylase domain-containing protein, partial [Prevotellaceae bacterium]|nr:Eco57I restriction-modification methylase domain-containing protein [Prevotellaceae bacterium]